MIYLLYTLHIILCAFLILVVLLQQGKGADLSVFGGGATMTAFGARGATSLLHRLTVGGFVGFVLTTMSIAYYQSHVAGASVMTGARARHAASAPATTPATPASKPGQGAPPTTPPPASNPSPNPATPPPAN